jgi:hypothetical protein
LKLHIGDELQLSRHLKANAAIMTSSAGLRRVRAGELGFPLRRSLEPKKDLITA